MEDYLKNILQKDFGQFSNKVEDQFSFLIKTVQMLFKSDIHNSFQYFSIINSQNIPFLFWLITNHQNSFQDHPITKGTIVKLKFIVFISNSILHESVNYILNFLEQVTLLAQKSSHANEQKQYKYHGGLCMTAVGSRSILNYGFKEN